MQKDIAGAYAEEQLYIADKLNGIDTSWSERLHKHGYNMGDYQQDKKSYLLSLIRPYYVPVYVSPELDMADEIGNVFWKHGSSILKPTFSSEYLAFVSSKNEIYPSKAAALGVDVTYTPFYGGTLVEHENDIGTIVILPSESWIDGKFIAQALLKAIRQYVPNAYIDGNDFMNAGAKLGGCSFVQTPFISIFGFNLCFTKRVSSICSEILPNRSVKPIGSILPMYKEALLQSIFNLFGGVVQ